MKRLKQLSAAAIALALTLSVGLTAVAAGQYEGEIRETNTEFQNNQAMTHFSVVSVPEETNISVTVPLYVTFAVKDGSFVCPTGYAITNNSSNLDDVVHVSDISITMIDSEYTLVENTTPDEKQIHLTMTGTNSYNSSNDVVTFVSGTADGKQSFGTGQGRYAWNIYGNQKLEFSFDGSINGAKSDWTDEHELFSVTYTIARGEVY